MQEMMAGCPAERTLRLIEGRWKLLILSQLFGGTLRFSDLQRAINTALPVGVTPKMLTQDLRQMEIDGLVRREVYAEVPPKVEYSLTPLGQSLRPVVEAMIDWGQRHEWEVEGTAYPCAAAWQGADEGRADAAASEFEAAALV
jgi:DNA-binding HxlR family transcriptional regulator